MTDQRDQSEVPETGKRHQTVEGTEVTGMKCPAQTSRSKVVVKILTFTHY